MADAWKKTLIFTSWPYEVDGFQMHDDCNILGMSGISHLVFVRHVKSDWLGVCAPRLMYHACKHSHVPWLWKYIYIYICRVIYHRERLHV